MLSILEKIESEINSFANSEKAKGMSRFFKTSKGEYGEGDIFIGVSNPEQHKIAKKYYKEIDLDSLEKLINSSIHEFRSVALFILVLKYQKTKSSNDKKEIVDFYQKSINNINSWDLVDLSAPNILGDYYFDKNRDVLLEYAQSGKLWLERIALLSTFNFIKKGDFEFTLKLSDILLNHKHDLIHKAIGWMIREIGKRDYQIAFEYLSLNYSKMARTTLRYAIEKFEPEIRVM
ncbi:DNA alkylation repair protein, partial [bacterium]|nr:DNA alkylation repair protein [bacterium]